MSDSSKKTDERISELITEMMESELTFADQDELVRLLRQSESARETYVSLCRSELMLYWEMREGLPASPGKPELAVTPLPLRFPKVGPSLSWLSIGLIGKMAAAVLIAVGAYWLGQSGPEPKQQAGAEEPGANEVFRIAVAEEASWDQSVTPIAAGVRLPNGCRFRLREGYVELASQTGANVAIEGPADVEVVGVDHLRMHRGNSWVRASGEGVDFVIDTPGATLVDLGTEFGVQVERDGLTGAAVFEGVVRAESPSGAADAEPLMIHEGEAVILGPWPDAAVVETKKVGFRVPLDRPRTKDGIGRQLDAVFGAVARPVFQFGKNLVVNGDAERSQLIEPKQRALVADFVGWSRVGRVFADPYEQYRVKAVGPTAEEFARGETYFFGGDDPLSSLQQHVDLRFASEQIDAGEAEFRLSAWLGGRYNYALGEDGNLDRTRLEITDGARVRLEFIDKDGSLMAAHLLGPPAARDVASAEVERRESVIVQKDLVAPVPTGARGVRITVLFERRVGSFNSGIADNIEFLLQRFPGGRAD